MRSLLNRMGFRELRDRWCIGVAEVWEVSEACGISSFDKIRCIASKLRPFSNRANRRPINAVLARRRMCSSMAGQLFWSADRWAPR